MAHIGCAQHGWELQKNGCDRIRGWGGLVGHKLGVGPPGTFAQLTVVGRHHHPTVACARKDLPEARDPACELTPLTHADVLRNMRAVLPRCARGAFGYISGPTG